MWRACRYVRKTERRERSVTKWQRCCCCGGASFRSRLGMAARAREKCDNGAYAAQPVRAAQAVNKRVLVIYREADRVLPYRDALLAAGLNPVLREANGTLSLSDSAGLVLTGGSDVDPGLYGETRQAETEPPDEGRDALEASLVEEALAQDLP